ncbi:T9SS type A sorting domain-containing protein [Flavobacterium sp. DG1-102-2]|uniref:T9SS type A sorting domain-containing protein n=1 Tax=Flavobacterium sp. DG1-102-2 TaxID=3081663 RepID=UPI002949486F|nr:T9SS type A sorting domain-containing protein [Flavobacterium sp. DG1-102-2]MDV6170376.1 T9SS type A sorting domain-containing protein [Flavobacterium sp. DG1-102-2]
MKQIYVLAAALMLTAITANAQQNVLVNGDFENWTEENPVNFDKAGTTVLYNDLLVKETTISQSGNSARQESKAQGTTQYLEYGDLISVVPGQSLTISYSYMDNDTKARTRLWSSWLNDANTALPTADQSNIQETEYSVENTQWVNKTLTVTVPAGAAKLRYQIRTYHQDGVGGGYIYFDNLSLIVNGVAGVNDNTIEGLQLFPNPVSEGTLNITSSNNNDKDVVVYDMLGKTVLSAKVTNGTVEVSNLTAGIYIVKITEEGKTATRKLIKK